MSLLQVKKQKPSIAKYALDNYMNSTEPLRVKNGQNEIRDGDFLNVSYGGGVLSSNDTQEFTKPLHTLNSKPQIRVKNDEDFARLFEDNSNHIQFLKNLMGNTQSSRVSSEHSHIR